MPVLCLVVLATTSAATAQGIHHPFAVGGDEGSVGSASGLMAWIVEQESYFSRMLTGSLRAMKESNAAFLGLAGLSFAYGVFHAAGPGHGKAVITSYMVSNERALRRGLVISLLAALLQGLIAILLVGTAAGVFRVTAQRMNDAARALELAAYSGIIVLGLVLLANKGRALVSSLRQAWRAPVMHLFAEPPRLAFPQQQNVFLADAPEHVDGLNCPHCHIPDPKHLGDGFSWKSAATTIVTAGARPCSGAILVLVFSIAQDIFPAGVAAVFAMSLGTAITTGALATMAVFSKKLAIRFSGKGSARAEIVGRMIEVAAALCVFLFGLALLLANFAGMDTRA
ncbi:MAG TPA: nickel/cobalt transporter [Methylovirgula sp.]|nr:nickel/cobalt transporter [Methylovirgula sp.]